MSNKMIGRIENNKVYGDYYGQGFIFKDYDAFVNRKNDICYIPECEFENTNYEAIDLNGTQTTIVYGFNFGESYNSMFETVKGYLIHDFGEEAITNEFVDQCTQYVFEELDWQHLATFLNEVDFSEDLILYNEKFCR